MDHFLKSLEIQQRSSGNPHSDQSLSVTLHNIGECLMKINKPTEAMNHFQKLLEIQKQLSGYPQNDQNLSVTLHNGQMLDGNEQAD